MLVIEWKYPFIICSFVSNIQYYAQVNLNNPCPFWTDHSQCGLKYCAVKPCTEVSFSKCIRLRNFICDFIGSLCVSIQGEVPEGLKSSSYKVLESHIVYMAHISVAGCWLFSPSVFRSSQSGYRGVWEGRETRSCRWFSKV